jgi:hypothetical protein
MLEKALHFAKACHFGQPSQLPSLLHGSSESNNHGYLTEPFIAPLSGCITCCYLDRLQAV